MLKLSKKKERKSCLSIRSEAVYKSNKKENSLILFLLCLISVFFMYFLIQIADKSFNIFTIAGIGEYDSELSGNDLRDFLIVALTGCGVISLVMGLYEHSVKITLGLLGILFAFFSYNYTLVANGFTLVLNKIICTIFYSQDPMSGIYYIRPFPSEGSGIELRYFCLAVILGTCFLVACAVVRYCNPIIMAACLAVYSAPALAFFTFKGEKYFIAAVMCCFLVFAIRVSGYRGFETGLSESRISKKYRIYGRHSSCAAVQQAAAGIITISILTAVIFSVYDPSEYKRNENMDELGDSILQSVQNLGVAGFGTNTINGLNNGQIYNTGNLKYTGETMFKLKTPHYADASLYLRGYTAGDYNGKRWSELTKKTYRSSDDMWNLYKSENIFPQFMTSYVYDTFSPNTGKVEVEIVNENINPRTFLTSPNLSVSNSEDLSKAVTNYDNAFRNDSSLGIESYKQSVIWNILSDFSIHNVYINTDTIGDTIKDTLYNGSFSTNLDIDTLVSGNADDAFKDVSEFYDREEEYRKFVVDNYTSYPEIIDEIFPSEIDLEECFNLSKSLHVYENYYDDYYYDDYYYYYYDFDGGLDNPSFIEIPNEYFICDYYNTVIYKIREYIHSKAEYTLTPGGVPYGKDFVDYFLNENHKGYCVHFATAATLMLRKAGIPARYVEGYYISGSDLTNTDNDGYVNVPDSRAHAWTEVYVPLYGWTVVDFTPSYGGGGEVPEENDNWSEESDTESTHDTDSSTDSELNTDSVNESSESDSAEYKNNTDTDKGKDNTSGISENLKNIFIAVLSVVGVLLIWMLIRIIVLYTRKRKFNSLNTRYAAAAMYVFSLRILKTKGIIPGKTEGEYEFAVRVDSELPSNGEMSYSKFAETAMSAKFGKNPPGSDQITEMNNYIDYMSHYVIDSFSKYKKIVMKYVLFLQ